MRLGQSSRFGIESIMDPTGEATIPIFTLSTGHFQLGVLHAFSPKEGRLHSASATGLELQTGLAKLVYLAGGVHRWTGCAAVIGLPRVANAAPTNIHSCSPLCRY